MEKVIQNLMMMNQEPKEKEHLQDIEIEARYIADKIEKI